MSSTFDESLSSSSVREAERNALNTVGVNTEQIDRFRQGVEITLDRHKLLGIVKITGDGLGVQLEDCTAEDEVVSVTPTDVDIEPLFVRGSMIDELTGRSAVRGHLMSSGNELSADTSGTGLIEDRSISDPLDSFVDVYDSVWSPHTTVPADDVFVKGGVVVPPSCSKDLESAVLAMEPSTERSSPDDVFSACGFTYSTRARESIAYGDQEL